MRITIDFIPQREHRYITLGDYGTKENGDLWFKITDTGDVDFNMFILFHELYEKFACIKSGVTNGQIDAWDLTHENFNGEPGEIPGCPYFDQHAGANIIESLLLLLQNRSRHEYNQYLDAIIREEIKRKSEPEGL